MDEVIEEASKKYQGLVPLVYDIETMGLDEARPQDMPYAVYLKREADKVIADLEESHKMEVEQLLIEIAELKQKINEVHTELELWRDGSIISEAHLKELDAKRHSDFKRCLAMAKWCESEWNRLEVTAPIFDTDKECWEYNSDYWQKWYERWLKIAEKFKEAK